MRFEPPAYKEHQIHNLGIKTLKISHDEQYLICGIEDGSLSLLKIFSRHEEQEQPTIRWEDRQKMTELVNDMMFIHASRVIEVNENIKKLNFEVVKSEQTVMIET